MGVEPTLSPWKGDVLPLNHGGIMGISSNNAHVRLSGPPVKVRFVCPEHRFGGADDRSRTCNPVITNHLLCQLSLHLHNAPQCASPQRSCPSFRAAIQRGDKDTKKAPFVSGAGVEPAIPCPNMTPARFSYPERGILVFPRCHQFERRSSHHTGDSSPCGLVPLIGFEPMSNGLKDRCSTTEPKTVCSSIPSTASRTPSAGSYNRLIEDDKNALRP